MQRCKGTTSARIRPGLCILVCIPAFLHFLHFCMLCAFLFISTPPLLAAARPRGALNPLARRAGDRLVALQRDADRLASEERTLLNDLRKLEIERQIKAEQLKLAPRRKSPPFRRIWRATAAKMAALEASESAPRCSSSARASSKSTSSARRATRGCSCRRRISGASAQASRTVAALAQLDRDRIARHEQTIKDLTAIRATLEERKRTAVAARRPPNRRGAPSTTAAAAKSNLVREIDSRRDLNAQLSGESQASQAVLQLERPREIGTASGETPTPPLRPFRGDLNWPAAGQAAPPVPEDAE